MNFFYQVGKYFMLMQRVFAKPEKFRVYYKEILKEIQTNSIKMSGKIKNLFQSVKNVNVELWNIEDKLRIYEKNRDFGKNFIELARGVYFKNDDLIIFIFIYSNSS